MLALYLAFNEDLIRLRLHPEVLDPNSGTVENRVNLHLQMTTQQMELRQAKARSQAAALPKIGDRIAPNGKSQTGLDYGVDFSTDPMEDQAYQDLNRHPKEYSSTRSPHNVIQDERAQQEIFERQQLQARQEYVQKFIENARKNGYLVRVNEDFVVTHVQKIQDNSNSQGTSLFDSSAQ